MLMNAVGLIEVVANIGVSTAMAAIHVYAILGIIFSRIVCRVAVSYMKNLSYYGQSELWCIVDINECLGSSNSCKQGCMNLEGNYVCRCTGNLVLAPDKKSCVGNGFTKH